jgi:hypothetical protein
MADEMSDFDRAHLEFIQQRMAELESENQQSVKALGEMFGIENLKPDSITFEVYERLTQKLVDQLRHWGNTALADRFQAAQGAAWLALKDQGRILALGQERGLTALELVDAEAAQVVADDANEHLEHVQAEISAYCKGLDEKGVA